jgi:cAMP phosphodiesterase
MDVRILPSSTSNLQYLTSFLINKAVAIDAGCLGYFGDPELQSAIQDVFLSHTHADHVGSLPILLENRRGPLRIYGSRQTLDSLRMDIFNDRIWPDLLGRDPLPGLRLVPLEPEVVVEAGGLRILPVEMNHTVPTLGFIVDDGRAAVVFSSDSGPADRIWELARARGFVKGAFVESSFPNRLEAVARRTAHLTPALLREEVAKLPATVQVVAVHIKAGHHEETVEELQVLGLPNLEIGVADTDYDF